MIFVVNILHKPRKLQLVKFKSVISIHSITENVFYRRLKIEPFSLIIKSIKNAKLDLSNVEDSWIDTGRVCTNMWFDIDWNICQ